MLLQTSALHILLKSQIKNQYLAAILQQDCSNNHICYANRFCVRGESPKGVDRVTWLRLSQLVPQHGEARKVEVRGREFAVVEREHPVCINETIRLKRTARQRCLLRLMRRRRCFSGANLQGAGGWVSVPIWLLPVPFECPLTDNIGNKGSTERYCKIERVPHAIRVLLGHQMTPVEHHT